jgi:hypothetical protein
LKHLVKILDQAEAKQGIGCTLKAALKKKTHVPGRDF